MVSTDEKVELLRRVYNILEIPWPEDVDDIGTLYDILRQNVRYTFSSTQQEIQEIVYRLLEMLEGGSSLNEKEVDTLLKQLEDLYEYAMFWD